MSEHRFATSVARLDTDVALPPPPRPGAAGLWRGAVRFLRGISGLDAYDRYREHHRRTGCAEPMSEAEFWRSEWDAQERNPKARCC